MKKTMIIIVSLITLLSITSNSFAAIGWNERDNQEINILFGVWQAVDKGTHNIISIGFNEEGRIQLIRTYVCSADAEYQPYNAGISIYSLTYDEEQNQFYLSNSDYEVSAKISIDNEKLIFKWLIGSKEELIYDKIS